MIEKDDVDGQKLRSEIAVGKVPENIMVLVFEHVLLNNYDWEIRK